MRYIKVKNQFVGFHQWEDAPPAYKFLRDLHRHVFKVETTISTTHNDRELEFFDVQDRIQFHIGNTKMEGHTNTWSCEDYAEYILDYLKVDFPGRKISVEVSEDGENTGIVDNYESFNPEE
jgi:6-pyruvoyl-tetrahydropterin synthase